LALFKYVFFTTKKEGTGLGMVTCFSIAKRHNATIDIETSPNGTTFNVIFKVVLGQLNVQ